MKPGLEDLQRAAEMDNAKDEARVDGQEMTEGRFPRTRSRDGGSRAPHQEKQSRTAEDKIAGDGRCYHKLKSIN